MKTKQIMSLVMIFLIVLMPQAMALSISSVQMTQVTDESVVITWQTDEKTDSRVRYGTNKSDLDDSSAGSVYVTSHSVTVENLDPETAYYYSVENRGETVKDNNSGELYNFTTLAEGQTPIENITNVTEETQYIFTGMPPIILDAMPATSMTSNFTVKGTTNPNTTIRIFINERKLAETITETGISILKTPDGRFEATVQLQPGYYNRSLGLNVLKIEATTPQFERNLVYHSVTLDITPPTLLLNTIPAMTNQQKLTIKGSVDEQVTITFIVNNKTTQTITADGVFTQEIALQKDNNTLEIIATDQAGLTAKHSQKVVLDTTPPKVELKDFERTYHFSILTLEGTTEPNTQITVINQGTESYDIITRAENVTGGIRGQRRGREENLTAGFIASPLGAVVGYKKETIADGEGKFEVTIGLTNGTNNLVIIATDPAGNEKIIKEKVELEEGSALWKVSMITTVPNEVYTDNLKEADVHVGIMYTLNYFGVDADAIKSIRITSSLDGSRLNNDFVSTDGNPIVSWDPDKGEAFVYQKLRVRKLKKGIDLYDEEQLPDTIRFALKNTISYRLRGITDRRITQRENYYYETAVTVEKPLDYNEWLTPEFINKSIKILNATARFLEDKAIPVAKIASFGGLATCAGMVVASYIPATGLASDPEWIFNVCDRTLCPYVPPKCDSTPFTKVGNTQDYEYINPETKAKTTVKYFNYTKPADCQRQPDRRIIVDGKSTLVKPKYFTIETEETKKFKTGGELGSEQPIIRLPKGYETDVARTCGHTYNETWDSAKIVAEERGCYNARGPSYDSSKCLVNKLNPKNPWLSDQNPYEGLLSSTACVCLPGIYGNLQNWLKITEGAQKCMIQAREGNVQGGYCERLIAIFTCDLITSVLKMVAKIGKNHDFSAGDGPKQESGFEKIKTNFRAVNTQLANRYSGIVKNKIGLNTQDIVHKACVGAFTGDWSELTNILEQSIRIPVSPIIGPMMPSSRITSYNPFTGKVYINYLLTLGIMSGGQRITGRVTLYCDPAYENNEYCPNDVKRIATRSIIVPIDGSVNENWAYEKRDSLYWANVAVMELEYTVGEQLKKETFVEPITRKGGLIAQCKWSMIPPQILCEALTPAAEGLVEMQKAELSPRGVSRYYPGNTLGVHLDLRNIGSAPIFNDIGQRGKTTMIWELTVPAAKGGEVRTETNKDDENNIGEIKKLISDAFNKGTEANIYIPILKFEDTPVQETNEIILSKITPTIDKIKETAQIKRLTLSATGIPKGKTDREPITITHIRTDPFKSFSKWKDDGKKKVLEKDFEDIKEISIIHLAGSISDYDPGSIQLKISNTNAKFTTGQAPKKVTTKYPESANYKLTVTLWEDVGDDNQISEESDNLLLYENRNQSKTFRFTFNPNKPDCEKVGISPQVQIISPRENTIIRNCSKGIEIQAAAWDDCMETGGLQYARLYHTSVNTKEGEEETGTFVMKNTTHKDGLYTLKMSGTKLQKVIDNIEKEIMKTPDKLKLIVQVGDISEPIKHDTDSVQIELDCS